jgi:hypothetical protein
MKKIILALSFAFGAVLSLATAKTAWAYNIQKVSGSLQITIDPKETFVAQKVVDVLFVVDDSASMSHHQAALADYTNTLANQLRGLNIHAGVITTDDTTYNPEVGIIKWVDNKSPDWVNQLKKNLMPGTNGSSMEAPFRSVTKAMTEPLLSKNAGFFRADADLVIVLLTDADDQSVITVADFQKFLINFKGDAAKIGFHGLIVPTGIPNRDQCTMEDPTSVRIEETINFFKGIEASLCDPASMVRGIQDIGQDIIDRAHGATVSLFTLPMTPDLSTMRITFGNPLIAGDAEYGWIYLSSTKQIQFGSLINWGSQPDGTPIVINYVPVDWTK